MLLNSGVTLSLFCVGQINLTLQEKADLYLQKTKFGWTIGGSVPTTSYLSNTLCHFSNLQKDLTKFWKIEETSTEKHFTAEEKLCEEHFIQNVTRNQDGRYSVALPLKPNITQLGESRQTAYRRLRSLLHRFSKDPMLEESYLTIIQEYIDLGHMSKVSNANITLPSFYLPHHAVYKNNSMTTKLRVVFDGSAQSTSGTSLNENLMVGPTIHTDLFSLLLRFRTHQYVLTADIEKMFRQFLIHPGDRLYQRILWSTPQGEILTYKLNTVTFGLGPSPYLAVKCLQQLAEDEKHNYPKAARVIIQDTYVDDILTGADTLEEAIGLRDEIINLLKAGGLNVRQWASNHLHLINGLPKESINKTLLLGDEFNLKTLGIFWNSTNDRIEYTVNLPNHNTKTSKRTILLQVTKNFDPLGLLGPVIMKAKIFIQQLWNLKQDWDESLPLTTHWHTFFKELPILNQMDFSRSILLSQAVNVQLHGFCDASEKGYGACLYLRTTDGQGNISMQLICSKSRVAPLKTVTIPILELCGALLLTRLYEMFKDFINVDCDNLYFWTDSTIVLHWLNTSPQQLKIFVANRVAEIQNKINIKHWYHVRTHDNPADTLSRGQTPTEFICPSILNIWQHGPSWLSDLEMNWPFYEPSAVDEKYLEKREVSCFANIIKDTTILEKYSNINKLYTIIALYLRFKQNNKCRGPISTIEMSTAKNTVIKLLQGISFHKEVQCLQRGNPIMGSSRLNLLNTFLDEDGILRVGGRLQNNSLLFSQRHPILIPKNHHVTRLLIEEQHPAQLHTDILATLYAVRRKFWVLDGRNQVRKVIRTCSICCRLNPPPINYIMGNLPPARVNVTRPFSKVGIDYCGPFWIKEKRYRNRNKLKVYVAIFVCLAVKAVHIEIVAELTTDAFLAAFKRFIARRGISTDLSTDNGTNFVGANRELKELQTLLKSEKHKRKLTIFSTPRNIRWHFIPARAPNFGGLLEAAVKSFKHHLYRVVGSELFTFEDFNTFFIEVEAILNSRPLTPISSDPISSY